MWTAWFTSPSLDWNRPGEQVIEEYNRGDMVKAQVLDVDVEKERISLGIKQLGHDAIGEAAASGELRKGAVVTCEVTGVKDGGLEVRLVDHDVESFIKRSDLSRDRAEQRPERFSVGQKVDARVTVFDKKTRRISVSIKALEIAEEKEAVAQFGFHRFRRLPRRHPRRSPEEQGRRRISLSAFSDDNERPRRSDPAGFFDASKKSYFM